MDEDKPDKSVEWPEFEYDDGFDDFAGMEALLMAIVGMLVIVLIIII